MEGAQVEFPEVVGISHYEKIWNHLDKRELGNFRLTKLIAILRINKLRNPVEGGGWS